MSFFPYMSILLTLTVIYLSHAQKFFMPFIFSQVFIQIFISIQNLKIISLTFNLIFYLLYFHLKKKHSISLYRGDDIIFKSVSLIFVLKLLF